MNFILVLVFTLVAIIFVIDYRHNFFTKSLPNDNEAYYTHRDITKNKARIIYGSICLIILPLMLWGIKHLCTKSYTEVEYRGSYAYHVGFNEYWETWVEATCSRQVPCGETCTTDSEGRQSCTTQYCTEYYDCSYCDKNEEEFYVLDDKGKRYNISKAKYKELVSNWKNPLNFIDLGRNIRKYGRCGIDGNRYTKNWDRNVYTSENLVKEVSYKNKGKSSASNYYKFSSVSKEEATKLGLYEYPNIINEKSLNKQRCILGIDKLPIPIGKKDSLNILYEHLNANGNSYKCKVFILLFADSDLSKAIKQRDYWVGGKRNEVVVCIGYNSKTMELDWVNSFGLCDNNSVFVDIREDIMDNYTHLDLNAFYPTIVKNIKTSYVPKDVSVFDFITLDISNVFYVISLILIGLVVIGLPFLIKKLK